MSLIKQVLQLKQLGESNRGISRKLPIDKETVNGYVNIMTRNGWSIDDLLAKEDPELERMFHAGSPAYSDPRMTDFLAKLPYFKEQLTNPKLHVTHQLFLCDGKYFSSTIPINQRTYRRREWLCGFEWSE